MCFTIITHKIITALQSLYTFLYNIRKLVQNEMKNPSTKYQYITNKCIADRKENKLKGITNVQFE